MIKKNTMKNLLLVILIFVTFTACDSNSSTETIENSQTPNTQKFHEFDVNLSKASIPLNEVLSGGPDKDGIPAINTPKFIDIKSSLEDENGLGIFLEIEGDQRFYPFSILVWHEIVNDTVGEKPVAVTFCPLCGSAIVFDREVEGQVLQFGVSGFLYESNLLMYDKQTNSFWSQVLGEAVIGDLTGRVLKMVEMQRLTLGEVREKHPQTKVLSNDTGYKRDYSNTPYGDYSKNEDLIFPVSVNDNSFHPKEMMLIVPLKKKWAAFPWDDLREAGSARLDINGTFLNVSVDGSEVTTEYKGESLATYFEMWFSFATHHQDDGIIWTR